MSSDVERENTEIQKLNLFDLKKSCMYQDGRIREAIVLVSILFENLLKAISGLDEWDGMDLQVG